MYIEITVKLTVAQTDTYVEINRFSGTRDQVEFWLQERTTMPGYRGHEVESVLVIESGRYASVVLPPWESRKKMI